MTNSVQASGDPAAGFAPLRPPSSGDAPPASEPGGVRYEIDVPSSVLNYHGTIHGGFVSTLLEVAAGMATYAYGVSNVALACSTNFIRAVGAERVAVTAEASHKGRSTAVVHCSINQASTGKLVAEATYTMFLLGPLA